MDPLTPNRIQKLMHLAEDSSYNMPNYEVLDNDEFNQIRPSTAVYTKESGACESSSGLLDLDQIQGFGEDLGSISKSGFHPGEITGRSTGAEENIPKFRHSCINMDTLTTELNRQTYEIRDIMRHSIATNYSFHHTKNLTADEENFIKEHAALPVQQTHNLESSIMNMSRDNSNVSVGAYFRHRCPDFGNVLGPSASPDRSSMQPSITEVSTHMEPAEHLYKLDPSLDSIPVRQPRNPVFDQLMGQQAPNKIVSSLKNSNKLHPAKKDALLDPFKMPNPVSTGMNLPKSKPHTEEYMKPSLTPVDIRKTAASSNNSELYVKTVTQSKSVKAVCHDITEESMVDNSLSISKIAEFLGNLSTVRVSDIMQFSKNKVNKPLSELKEMPNQEQPVTYLKDTRNVAYATSTDSVETVISVNKADNQENKDVPKVVVTRFSVQGESDVKSENSRSKTSSTRSRSTLSTVHENCAPDSPLQSSRGEANASHVPSPTIEYKELDKSVDWHEVMQQKRRRQQGLAKEEWAEVTAPPVDGYVGVTCVAMVSVVTLTDSWLTASFSFDTLPKQEKDLRIDLPRQPLLLSPGKTDNIVIHITSSAAMKTVLPYTVSLKDSSIDTEREFKGNLELDFKMPIVQAMSSDGINKLNFPPTLEKTRVEKTFVLISDSPVDLQLSLLVNEGSKVFSIKNVQEIKKSEVNRVLKEQFNEDDGRLVSSKQKNKALTRQLCRLTRGSAIRATAIFDAPSLSDRKNPKVEIMTGAIFVNLIDVGTMIKQMELTASVGTATLSFNVPDDKLFLIMELTKFNLCHTGTVAASWVVKLKMLDERCTIQMSDTKIDMSPGEIKAMGLSYKGPGEGIHAASLTFEETLTGAQTILDLYGGAEKPKHFPIKTNCPLLSWIRSGRKEISLKNSSDKKVQIRCHIVGDAFTIDMPGVDARGTCCIIQFSPNECRPLPIVYSPTSYAPNAATLHLMFDKNSDSSRKIKLYGCSSGDALRWSGLATYGETALVRAVARAALELRLTNKSPMPAFVCARVNFNLQYMCIASSSRLSGARSVVRGRGAHSVALRVDWARVERRAQEARAPTLATLTALTGPELTRRRILRILRSECNGAEDASLLPENLRMLVGPFEGEDPSMDSLLADFQETRASLVELIGGLQELKAQIDLPLDIAEETIVIADDSVVEHHTMYE